MNYSVPIFVDAHLGATYNGDTYEIGRFDTKIMTTEAHLKELELLKDSALESLGNTASESELEQWRVLHIGRRGQLTKILRSLQTLSESERRTVGATANQVKKQLSKIKCPVLLVHSKSDLLTKTENLDFAYNSISSLNKEKFFVNNAGHNLFIQNPDQKLIFEKISSFLKDANETNI